MDERLALHAMLHGYLLKGDLDRAVRDEEHVGVGMTINMGEAHPMGQRPYRLPLTKRAVVDKEIADMLDKGFIRPSHSPWASPTVNSMQ